MPRRRTTTATDAEPSDLPTRPKLSSTQPSDPPAPAADLGPPSGPDPGLDIGRIRAALLAWFRRGHRDLPWRRTRDPYAIWISEIMLQQTRVDTVKAYFHRFMAELPTVEALAAAPEDQVLTLWSGLGYYSRARNLHAAAGEIVTRYGGRFPREPEAVRGLPGIGPYTAGAILSIAFAQQAPILDGNVIRVLARLRALTERPDSAAGKRLYWSLAEALVPPARSAPSRGDGGDRESGGPAEAPSGQPNDPPNDPGDFNQALMELGATVCLPQRPVCLVCPLAELCQARLTGDPEAYPPKKEAKAVPVIEVVTLVVRAQGRVLLCRRPSLGLWGGLWEPPTLERPPEEPLDETLRRLVSERLAAELPTGQAVPLAPFVHVLSHRELRFQPFLLEVGPAAAPSPSPERDEALERRVGGYQARRWITAGEPLALGLAAWVTALLRRISA